MLKHADFTGLASSYSSSRPNYSDSVISSIIGYTGKQVSDIAFTDIGAGTGIWTRMVASKGVYSSTAVEPNDDMRDAGILDSAGKQIQWLKGSAEHTGLPSSSSDWVSMASSFHWADFETATQEFYRVLKPEGVFTAVWNPRLIEANPLLVEIEAQIKVIKPSVRRVSSGRSGMTESLTQRLRESRLFEDVIYMEATHEIAMSTERYLTAWRSVNDLRVQLGPNSFEEFMQYVEEKVSSLECINATYLTRAWSARVKK